VLSRMVSSTPLISKVADAWLAGIITVAGTVASVVSLLESWTCKGVSVTRFRVTVAMTFPPFSEIPPNPPWEGGRISRVRVKVTPSLSIIARVSEPLINPEDEAIIV
jgi:hypothetical protein